MIDIADAAPSGRSVAHAIPPMLNHSKRAAIKASVVVTISTNSQIHRAIAVHVTQRRHRDAEVITVVQCGCE